MLESSFNKNLSEAFDGYWLRVENKAHPGTADVNYLCDDGLTGWLELKVIDIGDNYENIPRLKHLEPEQNNFLFRWSRNGGNAALLLLIVSGSERDVFLIDGSCFSFLCQLRKHGCTRSELLATSSYAEKYHVKKDMSLVLKSIYN